MGSNPLAVTYDEFGYTAIYSKSLNACFWMILTNATQDDIA